MSIIKASPSQNFTKISNMIFYDKNLSMKERGVFCTICSLPTNWDFSLSGLCSIVPDGKDSIRAAVKKLEKNGYLKLSKTRRGNGQYETIVEVCCVEKTDTENPTRINQRCKSVTENPTEYKKNIKIPEIENNNKDPINQSTDVSLRQNVFDEIASEKALPTEAMELFDSLGLSESEISKIFNASERDIKKCQQALENLLKQKEPILNTVGWLITAVRNDYKSLNNGSCKNTKPEFCRFPQNQYSDQDFEQLKLRNLAN